MSLNFYLRVADAGHAPSRFKTSTDELNFVMQVIHRGVKWTVINPLKPTFRTWRGPFKLLEIVCMVTTVTIHTWPPKNILSLWMGAAPICMTVRKLFILKGNSFIVWTKSTLLSARANDLQKKKYIWFPQSVLHKRKYFICFYFLKKLEDIRPLIALFWTSGDVYPGFQSQC